MKIKFLLLMFCVNLAFCQDSISGKIVFKEGEETIPAEGASIYWLGTNQGTISDSLGDFELRESSNSKKLIISYIGFKNDTLIISSFKKFVHFIERSEQNNLDEVSVYERRKSSKLSFTNTQNTIFVDANELLKAACCNLSESFETNPAIDVNFSDALTGTKQINMLGLKSPYILISEENIPMIRGASQAYGLTFTPGTWVESIQISKGSGSVVNGFESIVGQINTELRKPFTDNPLYLNLYGSKNGRMELNTHLNKIISDKWSSGLYIHVNKRNQRIDNNLDGFLDLPLSDQINLLNRFQYTDSEKGWLLFFNWRFLNDQKQTGQVSFNPDIDKNSSMVWGSEIKTNRWDTAFKVGYVFPESPYQSFGLQTAYSIHDQNAYYGIRNYNILHESLYVNVLYSSIFNNTNNKFRTGLNITTDNYTENVDNEDIFRSDKNIGAFIEWNHNELDNLSWTAGLRIDNHNNMGTFLTPRIHFRYEYKNNTVIRFSSGSGRKAGNVFAENQSIFGTNRRIIINPDNGPFYGLLPEIAWNHGISYSRNFNIFNKNANIVVDYFKTNFVNQVIVDYEQEGRIMFYNLDGKSSANSFQITFDISPLPQLEIKTAYKNDKVKIDYLSGYKQKQLVPEHRYFINLSWNSLVNNKNQQWKYDFTMHYVGKQRLVANSNIPNGGYSQSYFIANSQFTRVFSDKFEVYIGFENLGDFRQKDLIIDWTYPFTSNFDTSQVWGPVFGRMLYSGIRYKI
ncbi:MAG: TonB-dependent receptor [Flavobacteriaceae bacterium]|nr:TonB-dependent receptor [Flavobacteriaceae bacterium]